MGESPVENIAKATIAQVRDPVCGRLVYYFDRQECLDRFAEQPEVFLSQLGEGGKKAGFDRASRPEDFNHRGELKPGTPHTLEQPRVESGSG